MDCRAFRERHVGYVDDVLSAAEMAEMRRHVALCRRCARHDTCVRRGLMLARNLPQIQPSADFAERLEQRLRAVKPFDSGELQMSRSLFSNGFALLAASVIAIAALATAVASRDTTIEPVLLPPVVASVPESAPTPVASPSVVASLATGIPVWPAMFMLNDAPAYIVNVEYER